MRSATFLRAAQRGGHEGVRGTAAGGGGGYLERTIDRAHGYIEKQYGGAPSSAILAEMNRGVASAGQLPRGQRARQAYR